jgi:hypothetical protein
MKTMKKKNVGHIYKELTNSEDSRPPQRINKQSKNHQKGTGDEGLPKSKPEGITKRWRKMRPRIAGPCLEHLW